MPPAPPTDESGKKSGRYYRINIIHAQDDYDIPWLHSNQMLCSAVNASVSEGIITFHDLESGKDPEKVALSAGGG